MIGGKLAVEDYQVNVQSLCLLRKLFETSRTDDGCAVLGGTLLGNAGGYLHSCGARKLLKLVKGTLRVKFSGIRGYKHRPYNFFNSIIGHKKYLLNVCKKFLQAKKVPV